MMTAPGQKLGLRPNTPTRPSKPEGRANNPGQREFQDQENNEAKRGPEAGRAPRANHPPPLFRPRRKPDHGTHPGKGRRGENKAGRGDLSRQGEGNPVLLGDEDLGTEDLKTKDVPQTPEQKTRRTLRASPCHKGEIQERYEEAPGRIWEGEGPKRTPSMDPSRAELKSPHQGRGERFLRRRREGGSQRESDRGNEKDDTSVAYPTPKITLKRST